MTYLRRVLLATLAGIALLGAFVAPAGADEPKIFFTIGTGSVDGVYYPVGQAICRMLTRLAIDSAATNKPMVRCSAQPTGGSIDNINQLAAHRFDFAVIQSDVAAAAFSAAPNDGVIDMSNLRAVFSLNAEPFHLVSAKNSGIHKFADLRGKRVNIGAPGSGQREMMEALMKRYGITAANFATTTELPPGAQTQALCDGSIDAFVYVVGAPDTGIARATDECGAYLVPVQDPPARALVKDVPGYALATIPKGMYTTATTNIPTVGVVATLVTTADMDEDLVYAITRTVMENLNEIRSFHPALAALNAETMSHYGIAIPLHPGALRYFKERGWAASTAAAK